MKRRSFLKTTAVAGLSLTMTPLLAARHAEADEKKNVSFADDFSLNEATIEGLQEMMQKGDTTSQKITQKYLDRIAKIDKSGPGLNAVIELNPDALGIAASMDAERKQGKVRSLLHGIPVLIKDNIDTGDKMQTTAGSLAMAGHKASRDAFIVRKLRDAGAVLLGKTNLSEWANFRSEHSTSGWSSRGGQTNNPYFLDRNPSGSSSGSGVAVAANLCVVAVGTETDGSVTCPASVNGIVGIKPTVGLVSRTGIIPISHTQDTAGPMARTVRDAAILLGMLSGMDPDDPATLESRGRSYGDYTKFLDAAGLKGKRIGFEKKWKSSLEPMNTLFTRAMDLMKQLGATLIEVEYSEKLNDPGKSEVDVLKYEFKHDLNQYLSAGNAGMRSLSDIIEFNKKNSEKVMPFFGQDLLEGSDAKGGLDTPEYLEALKSSFDDSREILGKIIKDNNLDAITAMTISPAACTDLVYGDRFGDVYAPNAPAIAGFPHITVPCGEVFGLPAGISFFSEAFTEPELLTIAYAYEQASKKRKMPEFMQMLKSYV